MKLNPRLRLKANISSGTIAFKLAMPLREHDKAPETEYQAHTCRVGPRCLSLDFAYTTSESGIYFEMPDRHKISPLAVFLQY